MIAIIYRDWYDAESHKWTCAEYGRYSCSSSDAVNLANELALAIRTYDCNSHVDFVAEEEAGL